VEKEVMAVVQSNNERGGRRMGKTSSEVKQRWKDKAYKRYTSYLRYDTDQEIIDFIEANKEKIGTSNLFRDALEMYMNAQK
jgi:hypothetical protein